jgi:hypothetical protein
MCVECNAMEKCINVLNECIEDKDRGRYLTSFIEHGRSFLLTKRNCIFFDFVEINSLQIDIIKPKISINCQD